ncbi:MAG: carboxymuconolactone decarboxylase family protein [Cyanobacteria bacterium]|nr:carboxymuconolactone decarboxylase family protein [Cyanobacteriota bacterium]
MGIPFVHPNESKSRLTALSTNDLNQECCTTLERIPGAGLKGAGYPENVLGQLMHSPDLLAPFLNWWVTSKSSMAFAERQQELVILRIGCLYASDYVWKHHVPVAKEFGVSDEEIEAVRLGQFDAFSALEKALLTLTEAMVEERSVSAEIWAAYGSQLNPQQVIDLIALVSQYVLFSLTNNVLQVPIEESLPHIPGLINK